MQWDRYPASAVREAQVRTLLMFDLKAQSS